MASSSLIAIGLLVAIRHSPAGRLAVRGAVFGRVVVLRRPSGTGSAAPSRRHTGNSKTRTVSSCARGLGAHGGTSRCTSVPRDHWLPPDNFQEWPDPRVAHRTSPTNIGMGLLATLAAHDLGYVTTGELVAAGRGSARHRRGAGKPRRPPVQLVRHGVVGAAHATLRVHGGQRQPRGRPVDAGLRSRASRHRSADDSPTGSMDCATRPNVSLPRPCRHGAVTRRDGWTRTRLKSLHSDCAVGARERAGGGHRGVPSRCARRLEGCARESALGRSRPRRPRHATRRTRPPSGRRRSFRESQPASARARTTDVAPSSAATAALAARCRSIADGMRFGFLYDRSRHLFAIGYRLADADGPGRLDTSFYDLLASEARLASFLAIANGDVPQRHWFHLGRPAVSVDGVPTLLSWSASMFEYLMPTLVMRVFPNTLLDATCRRAVRRQMQYGRRRGVPWGISESAFNVRDRHETYQYKAFGVPGLGLKRGLADELVVAPYATALAIPFEPEAAVRNLNRLASVGALGHFGFYDAVDYTPPKKTDDETSATAETAVVVRTFMAHHQGMFLVALTNALRADVMVRRFHSDSRVQATELLLQERVPRQAAAQPPRPAEETHVASSPQSSSLRRFRTPHTYYPHTQFLSNGSYVTAVTNAGGGFSRWRDLAVTRWREDHTSDWVGQAILPSRRAIRRAVVGDLSAHLSGAGRIPRHVCVRQGGVSPRRPPDRDAARDHRVARRRRRGTSGVAHEPHRSNAGNRGDELRRGGARPAGRRCRAPGVQQAVCRDRVLWRDSAALLCGRRPRSPEEPGPWMFHVLSVEGRVQGSTEWETSRGRFIGRGRSLANPVSLDGRPLSGFVGAVLDPDCQPAPAVRLAPGGFVRLSFATGVAPDRAAASLLAQKYHDRGAAARVFAMARTHSQMRLRHLGVTSDVARQYDRLASRVFSLDDSLARRRGDPSAERPGRVESSGRTASQETCRSSWCARPAPTTCGSSGRSCRRRNTGACRRFVPTS